jgi:hypothetical protein|tara:strand:+ start:295 stop:444 length:150 start_codon:yes stop_codon:yes gene_type:complete
MSVSLKIYFFWLIGVILWNFGFPGAKPIADVSIAIILSMITYQLNRVFQ